MYPNIENKYNNNNGDRWFFFPFLTGAVVGGAAVGLTRPRPIVNSAPTQPYPYPPAGAPGYYYGYNAYSSPYPPYYR